MYEDVSYVVAAGDDMHEGDARDSQRYIVEEKTPFPLDGTELGINEPNVFF